MKTETLIVGGGLSGLYAAYRLFRQGRDFLLLEGRDRLGGRILSETVAAPEAGNAAVGFDLGPTWYWPDQPRMAELLRELKIESFQQAAQGVSRYEDPQRGVESFRNSALMPPSYRVAGGLARLIDGLAERLPAERIQLSKRVTAIAKEDGGFSVTVETVAGEGRQLKAQRVLLALPPRLAAGSIAFTPELPAELRRALAAIPTWMAGHAKVVAVYERPFWRERGLSGHAFSHVGPAMEIHDASQPDGAAALFGFLGIPAERRGEIEPEALKDAAAAQFTRLFGPEAGQPKALFLKDWANDPLTATEEDLAPLYAHPAYGIPAKARKILEDFGGGKLLFCATEAAESHGGYLEGALVAAEAATA